MDDQNKNLLLATALSFMVILAWFVGGPILFPQWFPEEPVAQQAAAPATAPEAPAAPSTAEDAATAASNEPAPEAPRLAIDTPKYIIESDASIVAPLVFAIVLGQ